MPLKISESPADPHTLRAPSSSTPKLPRGGATGSRLPVLDTSARQEPVDRLDPGVAPGSMSAPPQPLSPLAPRVKRRAPATAATISTYQDAYRSRLAAALAKAELQVGHLFNAPALRMTPAEVGRRFDAFRVSVLRDEGRQIAVANAQNSGGSGKFSFAMTSTGELLAAKSVRTEDKESIGTKAMAPNKIVDEVDFLRRYYDPSTANFKYGQQGKQMILMPLGLTDLAKVDPSLRRERGMLAHHTLLQVATQLRQMHADGLLHHDIKPANIVLLPDGRIRLIDMGEVQEPQKVQMPATPIFGAPETLHPQHPVTTKADIWSLGLTVALIRVPPAAGMISTSPNHFRFMIARNNLLAGLSRAQGAPYVRAATADVEEDIEEWAVYFRKLQRVDPPLAELVLKHMLVPPEQRATAADLIGPAEALALPSAAKLGDICRQQDMGPTRRALRIALDLRLADEISGSAED